VRMRMGARVGRGRRMGPSSGKWGSASRRRCANLELRSPYRALGAGVASSRSLFQFIGRFAESSGLRSAGPAADGALAPPRWERGHAAELRPPLPLIFVMTTRSWGNIAGGTGAPRRRLTSAVERVAPLLEKSASGEDDATSLARHPYRGRWCTWLGPSAHERQRVSGSGVGQEGGRAEPA